MTQMDDEILQEEEDVVIDDIGPENNSYQLINDEIQGEEVVDDWIDEADLDFDYQTEYEEDESEESEVELCVPIGMEVGPYHLDDPLIDQDDVICFVCRAIEHPPWHYKIKCFHCSETFHRSCVSIDILPRYKWYCQRCRHRNTPWRLKERLRVVNPEV